KEERRNIVTLIKNFKLTIISTRPIAEAIITRGGVSVKEVDPSTMESKLIKGLFIAGELLDVDALTGGFNMQIAFSTGYCAGVNS
ncbi:MAG: NAD(P)/FAD-dependent oxidoreductase, partial [Clostridium sp.]